MVSGRQAKANFNAAQVRGPDATAASAVTRGSEPESDFWTTTRRGGAEVAGLATVAGVVFVEIKFF